MSFFVSNSKKITKCFVGFLIPFVMFSLSLPIFADLPENEQEGSLAVLAPFTYINLRSADGTITQSVDITDTFDNVPIIFGDYTIYAFNYQNSNPATGATISPQLTPFSFNVYSTAEITLIEKSNLYICNGGNLKTSSGDVYYNFIVPTVSLSKSNQNISYSVANSFSYSGDADICTTWIYPNNDGSNYILGAPSSSNTTTITINSISTLNFLVFTDLEPGTYTIVYTYAIPSWPFYFASGIFINSDPVPTGDANIDYNNGLISFQEAAQQIRDEMNEVLNDPDSTDFEKQMAVQVADQKLDELKEQSDAKYNTIVQDFNTDAEGVVNSFIDSGSTDPNPYIDNLNRLYTDALTQAVTPEQGTFINTQYNLSLEQMQLAFDANYKKELDDVISDEDMELSQEKRDELTDKLSKEQEIIQKFEDSDYMAQLKFDLWATELTEHHVYKSIFDYLITDENSELTLYIQVPLAVTIISLLLATTNIIIRRKN